LIAIGVPASPSAEKVMIGEGGSLLTTLYSTKFAIIMHTPKAVKTKYPKAGSLPTAFPLIFSDESAIGPRKIIGIINPPNAPRPPVRPPTGAAFADFATLGIHLKVPQLPIPYPKEKNIRPITKVAALGSFLSVAAKSIEPIIVQVCPIYKT